MANTISEGISNVEPEETFESVSVFQERSWSLFKKISFTVGAIGSIGIGFCISQMMAELKRHNTLGMLTWQRRRIIVQGFTLVAFSSNILLPYLYDQFKGGLGDTSGRGA
jgi:hypothetical protein